MEISSAARTIQNANTRGRSRWESNARSATRESSSGAAPRRDEDAGEFSTAAAATRIAILRARTSRLPSRARSALRRLWLRSARSKEISGPVSTKSAIGKSPRRSHRRQHRSFIRKICPRRIRNPLGLAFPRKTDFAFCLVGRLRRSMLSRLFCFCVRESAYGSFVFSRFQ